MVVGCVALVIIVYSNLAADAAPVASTEAYSLQPLAGQPDTLQATPTAPPPMASVPPIQSNPYRMGPAGGGRKVAHALDGGPTYPTPPLTSTPQQAPPTSLPHSLPTYNPAPVQPVSSAPAEMAAFPVHQVVGVAPDTVGGVAQSLRYHWFYLRPSERYWIPFSLTDSASLEQAWAMGGSSSQVQTCKEL